MRFHDGAVDARGRFWAASMTDTAKHAVEAEGTVYRLDHSPPVLDGSGTTCSAQIYPVSIVNGIGWSPRKQDKMYLTDSPTRTIWEYDYEEVSGSTSNPRPWFTLNGYIQIPGAEELFVFDESMVLDGFRFDASGALWTAIRGAGMVLRIEGLGDKVVVTGVVRVPARYPSGCWFVGGQGGGGNCGLVITTAREKDGDDWKGERGGGVYWIDLGSGIEGCEVWKFGRDVDES